MKKVRVLVGGRLDTHSSSENKNKAKLLIEISSYQRSIPLLGGDYIYRESIKVESELHEIYIWEPVS